MPWWKLKGKTVLLKEGKAQCELICPPLGKGGGRLWAAQDFGLGCSGRRKVLDAFSPLQQLVLLWFLDNPELFFFLPDFPFATQLSDLLLLSSCLAEALGSYGPVDLLQPLPEANMGRRNYLVWIISSCMSHASHLNRRDDQHSHGSLANLSGGINRTRPWTLISLGSCPASDRWKHNKILNQPRDYNYL